MPKKLEFSFIKSKFEEHNYELLETEYINSRTRMKFKCPKHSNKDTSITYNHLQQGHGCPYCGQEKSTKAITKTHEQFIKDLYLKNPNIIVLGMYVNNKTKIKVKCKICNHDWNVTPNNLLEGSGCPCCAGKKVVKDINDIATTHPEIAKLMVDRELIYSLSYGSNEIVKFQCPTCNSVIEKEVGYVSYYNFSCKYCGDGISFPERIMFTILKYLDIDFEYDSIREWSQRKRYDFYIKDIDTIIEMHGLQHYEDCFGFTKKTLKEEQDNDKLKQELAKQNGVIYYIIIDSRESDFEFIKNNILKSKIANLYNLEKIDWNYIMEQSLKSLTKIACELWNQGLCVSDIANQLNISADVITKYLKIGVKLSICNYTVEESLARGHNKRAKTTAKQCCCITTDEIFESTRLAGEKYNRREWAIKDCCKGKTKYSGKHPETGEKLVWKYL